jgi:hypothetical protein
MPGFTIALGIVRLLTVSVGEAVAHNCKCRNRGAMYELGQTSCLHVDGGNYLARCEMKLNVSSWTKIEDACPISQAISDMQSRLPR